ncbi:MAG: hypothetical protein JJT85_12115 [Chromatiales bacterium]|nr:hypothetical protein [Chromatiales bacterium]
MSRIPMHVRGTKPRFFPEQGTDELMSMVLELATELWAVRERQAALEHVITANGIDVCSAIESWQPDPKTAEALEAERQRMVNSLFRSLEANYVDRSHAQHRIDSGADPTLPDLPSQAA